MLDSEVFDRGMALIMATYRNLNLTEKQIMTMRMLLSDLADESFMTAIIRVCRGCREIYPGTNLTALIRQEVDKFDHADKLTAEEAWGSVTRAIHKVGYAGKPVFRSKQVEQAIDCIGWREICLAGSDQLGVTRAHFMRAFQSYQARSDNEQINQEVALLLNAIGKNKEIEYLD